MTTRTTSVGAMSMASGAVLNLNAPKAGPFPGMLIIQDSNALPRGTTYTSLNSSIGGAPTSTLNGLIYFPNSSMTFHGSPSTTGAKCLLLVVNTLDVDATSALDAGGCGQAGLTVLAAVHTVALAE